MGEGAVVGQKLQDRAQQGIILCCKVGEQGRAAGPQGIRQGGGQQGEVLPEKGFPYCRPGGGRMPSASQPESRAWASLDEMLCTAAESPVSASSSAVSAPENPTRTGP